MLSQVVVEAIRERFGAQDVERVIAALRSIDVELLPPRGPWRDRIYLATLVMAGGDWGRFDQAVRMARIDWRDLLLSTGLEHESWPEDLRRLGFRLPYRIA
jgi:hypothetical protein